MSVLARNLHSLLTPLYGAQTAGLVDRILARVGQFAPVPPPRQACFSEGDVLLITYGDSILMPELTPLQSLRRFLDDCLGEAVSGVHVLPFFPYSSDDGFSVIDYRAVNPALGDWEDIRHLARDRRLMVDLVINHVSRESPWFAQYLADVPPGRDYFIERSPTLDLSQVVRPRSHPVLVPVHTARGLRYLWATFSDDQIDLDFANPDVLLEFVDILLFYLQQGADLVRLDAIAYLWKELGTACIHLPQTHAVVKALRVIMAAVNPGAVLLTETNVPHRENISYFGDGDEANMVYQFALPPLVLHALASGDGRALNRWAATLMPPPPGCTFLNFIASHDGIGLRALEGWVEPEEVDRLVDAMHRFGGYVSMRAHGDGAESPYEINIALFDACRGTYHGEDGWQVQRFLCSQLIMLALQGVPAIYIHSLLATPNDAKGVERTGRTRSINRRRWHWDDLQPLLEAPFTPQSQVFNALRRVLSLRAREPCFHPAAPQRILDLGPRVLAVERSRHGRRLLALNNLGPEPLTLPREAIGRAGAAEELIGGQTWPADQQELVLQPYQVAWLGTGG